MADKADNVLPAGRHPDNIADKNPTWTKLIHRCLQKRVEKLQFQSLAVQLWDRERIDGLVIARSLITCAFPARLTFDVLLRVYIETLLGIGLVKGSDVLIAIAEPSLVRLRGAHRQGSFPDAHKPERAPDGIEVSGTGQGDHQGANSIETSNAERDAVVEVSILEILTKAYVGRRQPKTPADAQRCLAVAAIWMEGVFLNSNATQDSIKAALDAHAPLLCDALGFFGLALLENIRVHHAIAHGLPPDSHKRISRNLTAFIKYWHEASPRNTAQTNRLQHAQQALGIIETAQTSASPETNAAVQEVAASMQLQNVMDLPLLHARGSMLIFISYLVFGHHSLSDQDLLVFLNTWFNGDAQMLATNLIIASFDNLASDMRRGENADAMLPSKSFLVNKIPLLLTTVFSAAQADSFRPYICIAQALNQVDPGLFPPPSLGMMTESVLPDIRQDFLFACTLHSLIQADNIPTLLGEDPMVPPPSPETLHSRATLLDQCGSSPEKVGQIVKELDTVNGNGGIIAQVIAELIRKACTEKDTMFLKTLCVSLSTKPLRLDILVQSSPPTYVLTPLCILLDGWHFEEDQGEYQPVYEEFASIFLFVLAMIYRFDISCFHLGVPLDSFVPKFVQQGSRAFCTDEMTPEQNSHLGSWIKGLFDTDGITDEVTSCCRPQEFYLLLPTILEQSVFAVAEDVIGAETLKSGLEYLLEPFLLPSVIAAANWMAAVSPQKPPREVSTMCAMLKCLVKAPTSSSDATAMHNVILSIASKPFTDSLRTVKHRIPNSAKDIDPILKFLEPHLGFRRGPYRPDAEYHNFISTHGSIKQAFRYSSSSLGNWSATIAMNPNQQVPRQYSPRLGLLCIRSVSATPTLKVLLEEVKNQTAFADGTAPLHLDVAVALVCADALFCSGLPVVTDTPLATASTPGRGTRTEQTTRIPGRSLQRIIDGARPSGVGRLNLLGALAVALEAAPGLVKTDLAMAETIVRLHRRVNGVLNAALAAATGTAGTTGDPNLLAAATGLDATTISLLPHLDSATANEPIDLSDVPLDMAGNTAASGGALGLDGGTDAMQGLMMDESHQPDFLGGTSDDADTFAGLSLEEGMDFGF